MLDLVEGRLDALDLHVVHRLLAALDRAPPDAADAAEHRDRRAVVEHVVELLRPKPQLPPVGMPHGTPVGHVRPDEDRVGPQGLDLGQDLGLEPGQGGNHGGDGRDADHDAQGRQDGAGLVRPDLAQGQIDALIEQSKEGQGEGKHGFHLVTFPSSAIRVTPPGLVHFGRQVAVDAAVLHADDPLGVAGHALLVGDQDDRLPFRVELIEQGQDVLAGLAVEVAGRLIGQQDAGIADQGAGDGDPLLLAAGELVGTVLDPVAQAHALEHLGRPLAPRPPAVPRVDQGHLHVPQGTGPAEQLERLKDKADPLVADAGQGGVAHAGGVLAVQARSDRWRRGPGSPGRSSACSCRSRTGP